MKIKIASVGAPFSGKTTTIARIFAELKYLGLPVEFLPEYAREHIRNRRKKLHLQQNGQESPMEDTDQLVIYKGQKEAEDNIMNFSGESIILISDGSTLNAHFYTLNELIDAEKCIHQYDLLFFFRNIERPADCIDGNRIHDAHFSTLIDSNMKRFFLEKKYANIVELEGSVDIRVAKALAAIGELLAYETQKHNLS